MVITRINEFSARSGKEIELAAFLSSILPYIRSCEGNTGCELLQDENDPSHFLVMEKWTDKDAHQRSIENFPSDQMAAAMPLFRASPKGAWYK